MSCRYADARTPTELWENVLAQRQSFRRIPPERLRLEDYFSHDRSVPDSIYASQAAVIEGFKFDRLKFKVAGSTYRSADLTHWLALETAAKAFDDAGFQEGQGITKETTGVILGNTLTGEFSRANTLRLRYPYVRRVVKAVLREEHACEEKLTVILEKLEKIYKEPFPSIDEESLAGGLSNTIAGRICNYFDLKGGGFTIDGACSSSLLAVAKACSALVAGDVDAVLAGGVDLSLDPFELVGFAKMGALAAETMRVYDARPTGFIPGEGCGFILLMRLEDAIRQEKKIYAVIKGWGISSDGSGGITRPEPEGQMLALQRAYARAGFGIETVPYFEGHGTGTAVGDSTELKVLTDTRRCADSSVAPAVISSIKTLIGHAKAAAGVAGLIKATMAIHHEILPPTTGCETPNAELTGEKPALKILRQAEMWNANQSFRAGVSSMGFGGINAHLVLEKERELPTRRRLSNREKLIISSQQDSELFLLVSATKIELQQKVEHLLSFAERLSIAELSDLAAQLSQTLYKGKYRMAIVASTPSELAIRLKSLQQRLDTDINLILDIENSVFYAEKWDAPPRIGFLFPGQGAPANIDGGLWRRRFEKVRQIYRQAGLKQEPDPTQTRVAQPAIVTASIAALRILDKLDIWAETGIGHSLGELTALHWAGAFDETTLLRISAARGRAMTETSLVKGSMLSVTATEEQISPFLSEQVVIAGINSPSQIVLSGYTAAIEKLQHNLHSLNIASTRLPVSHAFHSPLVADAAPVLAAHLANEEFQQLEKTVYSTVTGNRLPADEDLQKLLFRQITNSVRFAEAVRNAENAGIDLWLEVGPGKILSGLVKQITNTPVIPLDASGNSLKGLCLAVGAAFALGQTINEEALFGDRWTKPFNLDWKPDFLVNPCELAPLPSSNGFVNSAIETIKKEEIPLKEFRLTEPEKNEKLTPLDTLTKLVAERTELPLSAVKYESRMLSDLHLNSITVGELVTTAARQIGVLRPLSPTDFADASIAEIAVALEKLKDSKENNEFSDADNSAPGIDVWVHQFRTELIAQPLSENLKTGESEWQIFAPPDYPLTKKIERVLNGWSGKGVIVCLPSTVDEIQKSSLLLEGAHAVLSAGENSKFVLIQHAKSSAAFARTFFLENLRLTTCLINFTSDNPHIDEQIAKEIHAAKGYVEAHYDAAGNRFIPIVRPVNYSHEPDEIPLNETDILLVTGGAKGITVECVLALAQKTKVRLALLGTSKPENDLKLATNLNRFKAAGINFKYYSVDVTNVEAVRRVVNEIETESGEITAVLHAAAINNPQLIRNLTPEKMNQTLAVKLGGARNLLSAVKPEKLKFFIAFGSIIARTGLHGEGDYGLANEWLRQLTEEFQLQYPACRCLTMEWSIWAEIGMVTRVADLDLLERQGIVPIPVELGVKKFLQLLSQTDLPTSLILMSRFKDLPTFKVERPALAFWRFLEQPRIYYPGIELVVDVELSVTNDLYLNDHQFQNERLLPAVMGMEAMAQAAATLSGSRKPPVFRNLKFNRPIVVPEDKPLTIRLTALVREDKTIFVAIRSKSTDFQVNHFQAICCFEDPDAVELNDQQFDLNGHAETCIKIKPVEDLYGKILFHRGRFCRLQEYKQLQSKECLAVIAPGGKTTWFSQYLPKDLLLDDPARRDAAIHAVQACFPHATLLPIGVEQVRLSKNTADEPCLVHAVERSRIDNIFTYDLQIMDLSGHILETWHELKLRAMSREMSNDGWNESLFGIYLERKLNEFFPEANISVAFLKDKNLERQARSERAMQSALGKKTTILRRNDGKPETTNGSFVSASHTEHLTLAVAARTTVGCDIETLLERDGEIWKDLLGEENFKLAQLISSANGLNISACATKVWTAVECLKKCAIKAPLLLDSNADEWAVFISGASRIYVTEAQINGCEPKVIIGVLANNDDTSIRV